MSRISSKKIQHFLQAGATAPTSVLKGRALEDLICYVFEKIPGISLTKRNTLNALKTQEIDVAFWNNKHARGVHFLPDIILVECKNWSSPVGSADVVSFDRKVEDRGLSLGVLIAANGITGNAQDRTQAQGILASSLARHRRIVVITSAEIRNLNHTDQLVSLFQEKLCSLVVSGGFP
jgi:hypothetical protein